MADPFSMLESDHRQVERMLEALAESEQGPEREQLVQNLTTALSLHMEFEEANLYPRVPSALDDEAAREAEIEHNLAREGVGKLSQLASEPGFGAAVAMVQGGIEHHVEDEEGEMFPALREQVDEETQAQWARQMIAAKRDAGLLAASLDDATKDDLLDIAQGLGLDATSSMTKDELRDLVQSSV